MKDHSTNLEKMNNAVDASTTVCSNSTEKIDKLITDAMVFMEKFQSFFESNTTKVNEVISSLGSTLKTEKAKLQEVCTGLTTNHAQFNTSISSQISKLHDDLKMESTIRDTFAVKTENVNVLKVKLENAEKQVNDLLSEKETMKSYIADVTSVLLDIVETQHSMITITVKKHLAKKLRPVFTMLHRPEGVRGSNSIPKQMGEVKNVLLTTAKTKSLVKNELKRRKAREAEMDEHQIIIHEAEANENIEREAQVTLES
ncbi:unnamed protein product [Lactuca saligna]|uniref:Uncharacterized protein n=1 Tax=Lactuca saligna TaxID=75948 RepID=A0AA35YZA1_LACSI|nr:unnamed protein product [Lactuca saligna]